MLVLLLKWLWKFQVKCQCDNAISNVTIMRGISEVHEPHLLQGVIDSTLMDRSYIPNPLKSSVMLWWTKHKWTFLSEVSGGVKTTTSGWSQLSFRSASVFTEMLAFVSVSFFFFLNLCHDIAKRIVTPTITLHHALHSTMLLLVHYMIAISEQNTSFKSLK